MDCCTTHKGLQRLFGRGTARSEALAYRKHGAPPRIRGLLRYLTEQGVTGATVLDIGFGVGALHLELLRGGAAHATGIEIAPAYVDAARELAGELSLGAKVDYLLGDYALIHAEIPPADVVLLDRSVCCYPDWRALVEPSARNARRLYGLILPVDRWYMRAGMRLLNAALGLIRHPYRAYMHPRDRIEAAIAAEGLSPAFNARSWLWESVVYARS